MRTFLRTCFALQALIGVPAYGQGAAPIGGEFQVNTYTTNVQDAPSVSRLASGDFVVVWRSQGSSASDMSQSSIQGQRFSSDGMALAEEFQVNSYTTGFQTLPSVSGLENGHFVVVWTSEGSSGSDGSDQSIQGQLYDSTGAPVGLEFEVNTYTSGSQYSAVVAGLTDGGFVVLWRSSGSGGSDDSGLSIQGQQFEADGQPLGEQLQINTYTTLNQWNPRVVELADGGFVTVWQSSGSSGTDTSSQSIQGQRFNAVGVTVGGEFQVNTYTSGPQTAPAIASLPDGGFVIAWEDLRPTGPSFTRAPIQGQRFAVDGSPVGQQFQVESGVEDQQRFPSIAVETSGEFVVAWQTFDPNRRGIAGQRFAADGSPLTGFFQVSAQTTVEQMKPVVASLDDDKFLVIWARSESDGEGFFDADVRAQVYAAPRFALIGPDGQCLGFAPPEAADGTPVDLFSCTGSETQRWRLDLYSGPQRIIGSGGRCLRMGSIDALGRLRAAIGECGVGGDLWQLVRANHARPSAWIHVETGLCLGKVRVADGSDSSVRLVACDEGSRLVWRPAATFCTADSRGLCLNQQRFRVDLEWRSFDGKTGLGQAAPLSSDDSGLLWFFQANNWEMMIKVLDGCQINDRFWVFAAAATDVETTLTVTDTATGQIREYFNPLGNASSAITDTQAFDSCP